MRDATTLLGFRRKRELRRAARKVVREYVHDTDDSLAFAMIHLRCLVFGANETVTKVSDVKQRPLELT